MTETVGQTTWWLDWGQLPRPLVCARLVVAADDSAVLLDCDGACHRFSNSVDAKHWLYEDEYSSLSDLVEEGEVSADLRPPSAPNEGALVDLMMQPHTWPERKP